MELSKISFPSKSSTFAKDKQQEKNVKKQLFENWKVQKNAMRLSIWHLSTAKKREHVKLVFSKNSQCWEQMMLKELFNFLKKFNPPWDCKKTQKKLSKKSKLYTIITSIHTLLYQIKVPVWLSYFWEKKTLTNSLWIFLTSENDFDWLTWFLAPWTK